MSSLIYQYRLAMEIMKLELEKETHEYYLYPH
jgi:hypothetical protein